MRQSPKEHFRAATLLPFERGFDDRAPLLALIGRRDVAGEILLLRAGIAEENLGRMVDVGDAAPGIELEHRDRRTLREERQLATARLDLAARFVELDQLALEAFIQAAIVLGEPAICVPQPVAGVEHLCKAVRNRDVDRVEQALEAVVGVATGEVVRSFVDARLVRTIPLSVSIRAGSDGGA